MPGPCRQRLLAHTADIGLAVFAPSRTELLLTAAQGLVALLDGHPAARALTSRTVTVAGDDPGELLVNWLNELIFLLESRHFYLAAVSDLRLEGGTLCATVHGERYDPARHTCAHQIKAATYHRLVVRERHGRWQGQVYVDL